MYKTISTKVKLNRAYFIVHCDKRNYSSQQFIMGYVLQKPKFVSINKHFFSKYKTLKIWT